MAFNGVSLLNVQPTSRFYSPTQIASQYSRRSKESKSNKILVLTGSTLLFTHPLVERWENTTTNFKTMANFIEVGHSKNIANFEDLISFCIAYGTAYNPANSSITITALQAKHAAALADLQAVKTAKTAIDNATNLREETFAPCRLLSTRIISALEAVSPSKLTIEDAKTINRKIQGKRAPGGKKDPKEETTPPPDPDAGDKGSKISVSQQSYDSLVDHYLKLVETLSQEPLYTPNEADLSIAGLTTLITNMQAANTGVINATTNFSNARITRDKTLYDESTGLVTAAFEVRKYVKSLFGTSSPQYKQVSKLQFKAIAS